MNVLAEEQKDNLEKRKEEVVKDDRKYNFLLHNNERYMNYTALTFADRKISYEELHDRVNKYARVLYQKGIRQGDKIGVCALNTPESVYLLYALDSLGAEVIGISPLDNKKKIKQDIELTRPKMIVSVDMNYSNFKDYEKALNFSTILYSPVESMSNIRLKLGYKALQLQKGNFKLLPDANLHWLLKKDNKKPYERASYIPNEVTDVMFTGGSTGIHKGVELPGNGLNHVVTSMNEIFDAQPGMIHLGNIPIGHMVYGRMIMHYTLCNNMEFALTLKAMPRDFYDELVRTQANAAVGGPPHWISLIEQKGDIFVPSSRLKKGTLSNLYYATSGGEAKKTTTDKAINEALKICGSDATLGDGLGATETWASIMINNGRKNTPGTIGQSLSCLEIKLINPETNEEVKKGEKGLLYVSGPSVMLGYFNNQEETDKVIVYDETGKKWCNLGDYVQQIETGEYKYVGRQKRNFVSGVENIYPEQLEDLVVALPEVREMVVTAIPDEFRQFIPRYHISLYDKQLDLEIFEKRLKDFVKENLSENWLPCDIEYFYEPLERMSNSKINVSYYQSRDKEALENDTLKRNTGKKLLLKNKK